MSSYFALTFNLDLISTDKLTFDIACFFGHFETFFTLNVYRFKINKETKYFARRFEFLKINSFSKNRHFFDLDNEKAMNSDEIIENVSLLLGGLRTVPIFF